MRRETAERKRIRTMFDGGYATGRGSLCLREIDGLRTRVIYSWRADLPRIKALRILVDQFHLSGYLSREGFYQMVTVFLHVKQVSVPPWAWRRLAQRDWYHRLAAWLKDFLVCHKLNTRFWDRGRSFLVRQMLLNGIAPEEVAAHVFRLWGHRIRTVYLIRRAVLERWIPWRKPPPWRPKLPRNY